MSDLVHSLYRIQNRTVDSLDEAASTERNGRGQRIVQDRPGALLRGLENHKRILEPALLVLADRTRAGGGKNGLAKRFSP